MESEDEFAEFTLPIDEARLTAGEVEEKIQSRAGVMRSYRFNCENGRREGCYFKFGAIIQAWEDSE